ncbi:MAG TPA: phage tail sheath subtilisin-like domain-containing protein [Acidimicrobiales bacterium]|nr:phage tail sheath subtilisin-like domain-containing protein [Acidimicrobiales bacterium]
MTVQTAAGALSAVRGGGTLTARESIEQEGRRMPQYLSPGVYVEEVSSGSRPIEGVGTAVAAFVGAAPTGPLNTPTLVTNWAQYTRLFGEIVEGSYLGHAVYGYFLNGGGSCYIVRVGPDGAADSPVPRAAAELPAARAEGSEASGGYRISALEPGPAADGLTVEVTPIEEEGSDDAFKLVVKRGAEVLEEFDRVTAKRGRQNVVSVVNARSTLIRIEEAQGGAGTRPEAGSVELRGGSAPVQAAPSRPMSPEDYVGNPADRTGFGGLEAIDVVTMVSVPDLMAAYQHGMIDLDGVQAVQLAMIAHCELMGDRVAILDPPPGLNAQQVREWRIDKAGYDSKQACLYWPWISVFDPATGRNVDVPPSGHMAGIWGRNDNTRGVHKAPANEVIRGAVSVALNITKNEHDLLNPNGINCLRSFPARGIRVWGARTLSSDPEWRYLNVRRLFNYLEKSILTGTDWVVFEPNDIMLWAKIRRTIASFLAVEWRKGALFGVTPDEAFYVKCDDETNPSETIDLGQVICEIGVAPVKPAEFVVFRLSQFSGGTSLLE